ncbi:hypothetical protein [Rhodovulum kholense]|uniref:Uncharacterized protein n=1 Tax=Rhodovulum kholense TaxID=453584 RepID=A0A8E2VHD6_9RHOB|nr:hypothetical protein [Rhodovulum kholense]PTW45640.1 hypothetical protein C8N38_11340 [Rhodovulum kholense]
MPDRKKAVCLPLCGRRSAGPIVALGVALAALSGPAAAEGFAPNKAVVGASVMRWLDPAPKPPQASKSERKAAAQALDRRHGQGSHICSASGFGQRPRCFAR